MFQGGAPSFWEKNGETSPYYFAVFFFRVDVAGATSGREAVSLTESAGGRKE